MFFLMNESVNVKGVWIGAGLPVAVIAGPCVAESREVCMKAGEAMKSACDRLGLGYIFKASYDKANRSSIHSKRGPGMDEGLKLIEEVGSQLGCPTTTDVHEPGQADAAGQAVDLLQVPAFLCRQTDLLAACAATGKAVNVKKGQFMSPAEMTGVVTKLREAGAKGIVLTERGTFFGYHRLVNDFVGLLDLQKLGPPVCFDVTHSTQMPGGQGTTSGGRPDAAPTLARCAVAAGVHALFLETHPEPAKGISDTATMLSLTTATAILADIARLRSVLADAEV